MQDRYAECLSLKEHIAEQLWSAFEKERIDALQASLESLNKACSKYDMMKDVAEGEWYELRKRAGLHELIDICGDFREFVSM